jgi:RNA polymerase sigma-70 factor (ECF subfamily)
MAADRAFDHETAYDEAVAAFGPALERLARAYERDVDRRRDLLQDIHVALWRSLARFEARCALRTWVYRVAHNTAISHVMRQSRRRRVEAVGLEALETSPADSLGEQAADQALARERLTELIQGLPPLDREVIVLYLEGLEATEIGEVTGLSPGSVSTRVHRLKRHLVERFHAGGRRE